MYKVIDMNTYVIPFLIAFSVSAISGKFLIPFLRRLKAGQTEREDGPQSHLAKTGTPNMGGLMFMLGLVAAGIWCWYTGFKEIVPVLILTLGFGLVGFTDDYIKVVLKRSMGLRAWQKMLMQIVVSVAYSYYITKINHIDLAMKIPFLPGRFIDLGVMNIPALIFIAVATVNGTNFTDGVDGLAACVTAAMIGALLGFLIYNAYPAKVFMGDTGSLALGGFVAGMAYMMQLPLIIPIVGFIYMIEVISVIMQVGYFKATHGKRIFRMAPIHHHFELGGWSEVRVVAIFTIVTAVLSAICLLGVW